MATCPVWRLGATEIAAAVSAGELSACEVVEGCLDRISAVNPALNAFATLDAEGALAAARSRDRARASGRPAGPLEGVPFHVKDLIPTRGIETAYGSHVMVGHVPQEDVRAVLRLKAAGAILIGKTTTPEFGCKILTHSPRYGHTRNPWNTSRTPGGSSGGSAVAVASGMGPLAVNTDGGGSARVPAACCGVLGFKPSIGLVPSDMAAALFENHQYIGLNTRTTDDLLAMLNVVSGPDAVDPWTLGRSQQRFLRQPDPLARLRGLRILYVPTMGNRLVHPDIVALLDDALARFCAAGAKVERHESEFDWGVPMNGALIRWMLHARLGHLLPAHRDQMDPVLVAALEAGAAMRAQEIAGLPLERTRLYHRVQRLFDEADLIVTPTVSAPPLSVEHRPDESLFIEGQEAGSLRAAWYPYTPVFNLTGHPAISIPAGMCSDGLPAGLHAVGRLHEDQRLIDLAAAMEVMRPWAAQWPRCDA